jgi:hypothetical protein
MTLNRRQTERARRSSWTTTRVSPDLAQQPRQRRPGAIGAGGRVFPAHRVAVGGAQLVELRIGALFLRSRPARSRSHDLWRL